MTNLQTIKAAKKRSQAINAKRRKHTFKVRLRIKKKEELVAKKNVVLPPMLLVPEVPVEVTTGSATATRIIAYASATNLPQIALKYQALCGAARPVSKAIARDYCPSSDHLAQSVARISGGLASSGG